MFGVRSWIRKSVALVAGTVAIVLGSMMIPTPVGAVIDSVTVVPSPNRGTTNVLDSVSCMSESWCVAVGNSRGDVRQTLVLLWDGSSWSVVPSPNFGDERNSLLSVSCLSSSSCIAVGHARVGSVRQTLALKWDGILWSVVPSPNIGDQDNQLSSVSCVSSSFCMAAGYVDIDGTTQTLVQLWDGNSWSVVPSPSPSDVRNRLDSVSCASTSSCVAVGYTSDGSVSSTLSEVWNGASWSVVSSPNPSDSSSYLQSVSCVSTSWCTAVGFFTEGGDPLLTLAMVWDGASWSVVPSPNSDSDVNLLNSVSCFSPSSCIAVGEFQVENESVPLVAVWDGSSWSVLPSPNPSPGAESFLEGVSCVSAFTCMAVGYSYDGVFAGTVAMSLTGPEPMPVPDPIDPIVPAFTG